MLCGGHPQTSADSMRSSLPPEAAASSGFQPKA
jgi:hypothetical protein